MVLDRMPLRHGLTEHRRPIAAGAACTVNVCCRMTPPDSTSGSSEVQRAAGSSGLQVAWQHGDVRATPGRAATAVKDAHYHTAARSGGL
eukprot:7380539-Prymnesium_polylepis.3